MNQQRNWQHALEARLSRRDALRVAALGAIGLPFMRSAALAQATPAAADFVLRLAQLPPVTIATDVIARKGNKKSWAQLQGVSIAQVEIPVGAQRSPHLHTNTPELAVVLEGSAKVGLQTPQKDWLELDLQVGGLRVLPARLAALVSQRGRGRAAGVLQLRARAARNRRSHRLRLKCASTNPSGSSFNPFRLE